MIDQDDLQVKLEIPAAIEADKSEPVCPQMEEARESGRRFQSFNPVNP